MGFSQLGGHPLCEFPAADEQVDLTAFANTCLLDIPADTAIMKTDVNTTFSVSYWDPWSVLRSW